MSKKLSRNAHSALNRLVVACRDEELALEAAAVVVKDEGRRRRLQDQSRRRVVFRRDLEEGIAELGGLTTHQSSFMARLRLSLWRRRGSRAAFGGGEVYAACADATQRTAAAYFAVLEAKIPGTIRFEVERQYSEIDFDRRELHWLERSGGRALSPDDKTGNPSAAAARRVASSDDRALEAWGDEGGARE
jgi:uncharacterized protein (TIGR02284 family)